MGASYEAPNPAQAFPQALTQSAQNYWNAKSTQATTALQIEQAITEETKQQDLSASAAEHQARADSERGVEGTRGESDIVKTKQMTRNLQKQILEIDARITNIKQRDKLIKQEVLKHVQEIKKLKVQLPRLEYDALLDANPIIKAIIAVDRGLPIAQTILGAGALGKLGKVLGGKKGKPDLRNFNQKYPRKQFKPRY